MRRRTLVYTGIALALAMLIGAAGIARWSSRPALAEAAGGAPALMPDSVQSDSAGTAMANDTPPTGGVVVGGMAEPPFGELPLVMKGEFPDARADIALIPPPNPVFLDAVRGLPLTEPASVHAGGAFLPLALGLPVLLVDHNDHEHEKPTPPPPPPPGVVPEPAPLLLLGTGMLLLLGVYGWRRRLA